tara:strand:+ start:5383 stop:6330 length:948 start_codon:yes stop_codon:yes gene_type:complete
MEFEVLENKFSEYIGTEGCVAVNTGTAALHVALEALQLPKNSEVIVPQYTMIATAWAVYYARLNPVFVDCDDSLLIDIDKLEDSITTNTKVIMVTHVYGRVVNMDRIIDLAQRYRLRVIEDSAEAHGCTWNGKMVGSYDIGCFSFYSNKIVCGEEGGAVVSNDLDYLETVKDMKSMSFGKDHNYMHNKIGFNYRMSNSQASLILKSLSEVDKNITIRRKNQEIYDSLVPSRAIMPTRDVPWVYDVYVDDNSIVDELKSQGVAARYGFKPVSTCEPFRSYNNTEVSNTYSKHIMYLPVMCSEEDAVSNMAKLRSLM